MLTFQSIIPNVVGSLVAMSIGILLGIFLDRVRNRRHPYLKYYMILMGPELLRGDDTKIIPTTRAPRTAKLDEQEYLHFDAKEVSAIFRLGLAYRRLDNLPDIVSSRASDEEWRESNLVVVGGPHGNRVCKKAFSELSQQFVSVTYRDAETDVGSVVEVDGEPYSAEVDSNGLVTRDYIFLARFQSPFATKGPRTIFIAFGMHAKGTSAALDPQIVTLVARELENADFRHGYFAIVEASFDGQRQIGTPVVRLLRREGLVIKR